MTLPKGYSEEDKEKAKLQQELLIKCKHKYRNFIILMGVFTFGMMLFFGNVVFPEYFISGGQELMLVGFFFLGLLFLGTFAGAVGCVIDYFKECDTHILGLGVFCMFIFAIALSCTIYYFDWIVKSWNNSDDAVHKERVNISKLSCDQLKYTDAHGGLANFYTDNNEYFKHRLGACA